MSIARIFYSLKIFGVYASADITQKIFYLLTLLSLFLVYYLCRWLTSRRFGRLLVAIRDDETRVRFSGYDPTGYKVLVFAISGAIAGLAGAFLGSPAPAMISTAY
jgi:urea transport system permease protein